MNTFEGSRESDTIVLQGKGLYVQLPVDVQSTLNNELIEKTKLVRERVALLSMEKKEKEALGLDYKSILWSLREDLVKICNVSLILSYLMPNI